MHASPYGSMLAVSSQRRRRGRELGGDQSYTAAGVRKEMVGSPVLVVDTKTGEVIEPFPLKSTGRAGQWSPDRTRLVAYLQHKGPACLAVWDRRIGTFQQYPAAHVRPFFGFEVPRWTPDGAAVVVKLRVAVASDEAGEDRGSEHDGTPAVSVYSFDPALGTRVDPLPGWADGYRCDLGLLVQTRRFHAAVASSGFYNLTSVYGTMAPDGNAQWLGWAETGQGRMATRCGRSGMLTSKTLLSSTST